MSATKTDIPSPSDILAMRDAYNILILAWQIEHNRLYVEEKELHDLFSTLFRPEQIQESTPQELLDNDKATIEYYTRSHIYRNDMRASYSNRIECPLDRLRHDASHLIH